MTLQTQAMFGMHKLIFFLIYCNLVFGKTTKIAYKLEASFSTNSPNKTLAC